MFQEKTVLRMNHQHDLGMMNHMQLPSSSTTLDKGFITPNQHAPPKISISSSGLDSVSSTACSSFAITPSLLDAIMMEEAGAVMSPPLMKAFHSSEGTYLSNGPQNSLHYTIIIEYRKQHHERNFWTIRLTTTIPNDHLRNLVYGGKNRLTLIF
ncbi:hypothetical protein C9374_007607 [Naegleria lovaniensis]|uniref:Uncharacterized protein n=1 Tax=Naegleria lovaniensis TaxID=51637 RepID=A0AA88GGH2_NAELO|nr:uncharacterized protein C9374_007607 [Naegleria lovaniensis]KAG2378969.1 hypothetical protein C9374_007607 [Naegleria lovaniensis]